MAAPAERMRKMRERRGERGVREIRLTTLDARSTSVRRNIAEQCARLVAADEQDALRWIEAVSEFDEPDMR